MVDSVSVDSSAAGYLVLPACLLTRLSEQLENTVSLFLQEPQIRMTRLTDATTVSSHL